MSTKAWHSIHLDQALESASGPCIRSCPLSWRRPEGAPWVLTCRLRPPAGALDAHHYGAHNVSFSWRCGSHFLLLSRAFQGHSWHPGTLGQAVCPPIWAPGPMCGSQQVPAAAAVLTCPAAVRNFTPPPGRLARARGKSKGGGPTLGGAKDRSKGHISYTTSRAKFQKFSAAARPGGEKKCQIVLEMVFPTVFHCLSKKKNFESQRKCPFLAFF